MSEFKTSLSKKAKDFCKENGIEITNNHMIFYTNSDRFSVGVLAEDTNYMIQNIDSNDIKEKEIKENLELLKSWIK